MNTYGLSEQCLRDAVREIRHGIDNNDENDEHIFALAVWGSITEPGDGVAGELIRLLGAGNALQLVIEHRPATEIWDRIRERVETSSIEEQLQPEAIRAAQKRWMPRLSSETVLRSFYAAPHLGARFITADDPHWLAKLNDLGPYAPHGLWVRGNIDTLLTIERSIALVGARAATSYGEHVTLEVSTELSKYGFTIISGAAYGIDAAAHRAALSNDGTTIAFLAGGTDRLYPSGNHALLHRIMKQGVVISEMCCGSRPTKWRFLQRNRLIAASACATVVLEAGWRSGSLNTAGHAATLGRPLGAIPGQVTSAASAGCHRLIREYNAICVTNAAEIAELTGYDVRIFTDEPLTSPEARSIIEAMNIRKARSIDDIAHRSGLSLNGTKAQIALLELVGKVREKDGYWVLTSSHVPVTHPCQFPDIPGRGEQP